jgi:hypothetical protein
MLSNTRQLHSNDRRDARDDERIEIVGETVDLVPAGSESGALRELVPATDDATLESVTLGAALYAGMEFAKPRVSTSRT